MLEPLVSSTSAVEVPIATVRQSSKAEKVNDVRMRQFVADVAMHVATLKADGVHTFNSLAKRLNAAGVTTKNGNAWSNSSIKTFVEKHGIDFNTTYGLGQSVPAKEITKPVRQVASVGERVRRTKAEIASGITLHDARVSRGVVVQGSVTSRPIDYAGAGKTKMGSWPKSHAVVLSSGQKPQVVDLINTLPEKIQVRAAAVSRFRRAGGKTILSQETLAEIERRVAAGQMTVCPPYTDSDGFNHLTGIASEAEKAA